MMQIGFKKTRELIMHSSFSGEYIIRESNYWEPNSKIHLRSDAGRIIVEKEFDNIVALLNNDPFFKRNSTKNIICENNEWKFSYHFNQTQGYTAEPESGIFRSRPIECRFQNKGEKKTKKWRIIFVGDKHKSHISMCDYIKTESVEFRDCSFSTFAGAMPINISGNEYLSYGFDMDDVDYFVIDSLNENQMSDFAKSADSISLMFGLVGGIHYRGVNYIIGYADDEMEDVTEFIYDIGYETSRPIFGTFPTAKIQIELGIKYPDIVYGSREEFEKICQKIYDDKEYARCIRIIVSNPSIDWESRILLNTIALESASNFIAENEQQKHRGILDKGLFKKIYKNIRCTVENFRNEAPTEAWCKFLKKLDGLNSPPNTSKLIDPYTLFDIPLNEDEKNLISNRNILLHGKFPNFGNNSIQDYMKAALMLHYCCTSVLLKACGYSGPIIKYSSIAEMQTTNTLSDWVYTNI